MNNDSFYSPSNTDNQFILSYELICLLQWLMEHDAHKLKKIVSDALGSGLREKFRKNNKLDDTMVLEDIQESMVDFFGMLETLILESLNEQAVKKALEKNLMPSIDHIDATECDDATVRSSIEKATSSIEKNPQENPKELLFKELLKRWKPNKKNILN